jgi:hypothetical protein
MTGSSYACSSSAAAIDSSSFRSDASRDSRDSSATLRERGRQQ